MGLTLDLVNPAADAASVSAQAFFPGRGSRAACTDELTEKLSPGGGRKADTTGNEQDDL